MGTNDMPEVPRSVVEEIKELFGDLHEDFGQTIVEAGPEVHNLMRSLVLAVTRSGRTPDQIIGDLSDQLIWMLLIGREHSARGFASPFQREDREGHDLISDDAISALIDDQNG